MKPERHHRKCDRAVDRTRPCRSADHLGVNEWQDDRCRSLVQVVILSWSDEVVTGRQRCCMPLLYCFAAALED